MRTHPWQFLIATACFAASGAFGQASGDLAPLFADHTPIEVTIEAPLTTLQSVRSDEDYLEGTFSYQTADGETGELDLKLLGNVARIDSIFW